MAHLQLYNSLTRKKEAFTPLDAEHVKCYACGPTVYDYAHIGNARMAVVFDVLARVLRKIYPKVTYVSNLTDVDDKIMAAAEKSGLSISKVTEKFARIYNEDMAALSVQQPDVQPKATEHVGQMITLMKALIERGHAYAAEGHVLFNVPSFPAYGGLSGRSRDEQVAGARVDVAPYKKDPADFVLWKPSSGDQPGWDSPWGRGRPGWHIECSAMAEEHLGLPFDIHGGGADLKFPHHENEIAQSCCAHGHTDDLSAFAKYWVHNGFLTVEGEKMSKSLGNFTTAHELLEQYPGKGEAIRLTLMSAHYRQPLDWSVKTLEQNKKVLDRAYQALIELKDVQVDDIIQADSVINALCDDLNTAKAIVELNAFIKLANTTDDKVKAKSLLLSAGQYLGLLQQDPQEWLGYAGGSDAERIDALVAERTQAKADKNWGRADEIRDQLSTEGILIEDTSDGVKWRRA